MYRLSIDDLVEMPFSERTAYLNDLAALVELTGRAAEDLEGR